MGELGTWLVRAREARGLTLEDAERDTRISRRYLLALETEQFDVIPAPVYARGFLRSYSQYLGLDPQEMLAMFPREDEYAGGSRQPRASKASPLPATSPSRPTWNRPPAPARPLAPPRPEPAREARREPAPERDYDEDARFRSRREPEPAERRRPEPPRRPAEPSMEAAPREPMIGVDIGVPAPVRRINPDPAAQTRSMVVAIVAVAGIIGVILLAFIISNLGSDSGTPGEEGDTTGTATATGTTGTASATATASGVVRGTVPDVTGEPIAEAKRLLEAAGYQVNQIDGPNTAAKGTVFEQTPQGGTSLAEGSTVTVAVSEGP